MLAKAYPVVARTTYAACKQLLTLSPKLTLRWACAVLFVASNEDCSMQELAGELGMEQVATSMMVTALSSGRPDAPGLELIETYTDTADRRVKRVRLTHRGKSLLNAVK